MVIFRFSVNLTGVPSAFSVENLQQKHFRWFFTDFEIADFDQKVNFDEFWVRERFSLGKVDFMGLVTLDNNLKNIYDVGYSPNEKQFPGYIQKVRAY